MQEGDKSNFSNFTEEQKRHFHVLLVYSVEVESSMTSQLNKDLFLCEGKRGF